MEKIKGLLKVEEFVILNNLKGMAYIVNSDGCRSNLTLYYSVKIDTKDNSIIDLRYEVEAFKSSQADHVREVFSEYKPAVEKYNELAIKWYGHRIFKKGVKY